MRVCAYNRNGSLNHLPLFFSLFLFFIFLFQVESELKEALARVTAEKEKQIRERLNVRHLIELSMKIDC
jgi:hypothetical protein